MKRKHPIQPIALDEEGIARFVKNRIVRFLLDQYKPGLNDIYERFRCRGDAEARREGTADYEQLMMLIGYSVSGFGDLDIDRRTIAIADRKVAALIAKSESEPSPEE
ncbi:hypothetical protein [Rhizobium leguminosarum]|uniref:hypothetical protein n=1 Tax=Rhizobium leguminosarum TaxID=384 RepID=UPI002E0FA183|nr:hypothetical protein U8Q02_39845 [Rhizobium leguminosarum]